MPIKLYTFNEVKEQTGLTNKRIRHAIKMLDLDVIPFNKTQAVYTENQIKKIVDWNKKYGRITKEK